LKLAMTLAGRSRSTLASADEGARRTPELQKVAKMTIFATSTATPIHLAVALFIA